MKTPTTYRFVVYGLALCVLFPPDAMAAFSAALARANNQDKEASFPQFDSSSCTQPKDDDPATTACIIKLIGDASSYCSYIAGGITKDESWWQKARIPILLISVTGTALGVSSIAAAKSWAAVGGTSGIASSWNSDTTSVNSSDDARLNAINTAVKQLSNLAPTKLASIPTALSVGAQCRATAGTQSSAAKPAGGK
jgi:hypothetical protein